MKNSKKESGQIPNSKFLISNFYPLTYLRSVEELRCGATTVGEHLKRGTLNHEVNYLWDLIIHLAEDLENDFRILGAKIKGKVHPSVVLYNSSNILIEEGVEVEPFVVLDARSGPIYIGKNSIIRSHSCLRGPLSIGPECRIGGEVSHSIFHGYVNKQHYGFIGHSYVGEWVNLGAGTTNSNLKNTYGKVKVWVNGKEIDSGEQFLGCFIGDYARLGIGTLINTGTVIGLGANVLGSKVTSKYIPNFQWSDGQRCRLEDFLKTVQRMMERRGIKIDASTIETLRTIYSLNK